MNAAVWYDFVRFADSIPLVLCLLGASYCFRPVRLIANVYAQLLLPV